MNIKIRDVALILTGGGMRCAWSGGFLYGLYEQGITPNTIVATSGATGSAVYFSSGQMESVKRIWTEHLPESEFISFRRVSKIIDIDFLVDEVLTKREPVDWAKVKTSPVRVLCPLRETEQRTVRVFSNSEMSYEVLRAAKALPLLYRKTVEIDDHMYRDYSYSITQLCSFAPSNSHKVVLDVRIQNTFLRLLGKPFMVPDSEECATLENTLVIKADAKAHLLSSKKKVLSADFESGRRSAHENKKLFLR